MSWMRISSGLVNHFKQSPPSITICTSPSEDNNTVTSSLINKSITERSASFSSQQSINNEKCNNVAVSNTRATASSIHTNTSPLQNKSNIQKKRTQNTENVHNNNIPTTGCNSASRFTGRNSGKKNLPSSPPQAELIKEEDIVHLDQDNLEEARKDLLFDSQSSLSSSCSTCCSLENVQHRVEAEGGGGGTLTAAPDQDFFQKEQKSEFSKKIFSFLPFIDIHTNNLHRNNNIISTTTSTTNTATRSHSTKMGNKYDIQRCCHPMFARRPSASSSSSSTSNSQSYQNSQRRVIFPTCYGSSNSSPNEHNGNVAELKLNCDTSSIQQRMHQSKPYGGREGIPLPDELEEEELEKGITKSTKNKKGPTETPIPSFISLKSNSLPQSQVVNQNQVKHSASNDDSLMTLSTTSISYVKRNYSYDDICCNDQLLSDNSCTGEGEVVGPRLNGSSPCSPPKESKIIFPPLPQNNEKNRSNSIDSLGNGRFSRRPSILRNNSKKNISPSHSFMEDNNRKHVQKNQQSSSPLSSLSFPARVPPVDNDSSDKLRSTFHDFNVQLHQDESSILYQQDLHVAHGNTIRKSLSDSCLNGFKMKKVFAATHLESTDSISCTSSLYTSRIQNKSSPSNSERRRQVLFTRQMTRHISHEEMGRNKIIRFDPRIWVHEIQCPPVEKIWYSESDLNRFKCEAVLRIRKWSKRALHRKASPTMIPTGTGRILSGDNVSQYCSYKNQRITYSNPALSCEAEDDDDDVQTLARIITLRQIALMDEFKSVLIVDNHDLFLKLLSKGIKLVLPQVQITTATSVDQALKIIEKTNSLCHHRNSKEESCSHGYDMIIIEERLVPHVQPRLNSWEKRKLQNGSTLIERIKKDLENTPPHKDVNKRHPLIVGVSAYLDHDKQQLLRSGADIVWGKPPPKMDEQLRLVLLRKIMEKRNRPNCNELFQ